MQPTVVVENRPVVQTQVFNEYPQQQYQQPVIQAADMAMGGPM
jgi:hypothetical protein